MMTKSEKERLFIQHRDYIKKLVNMFLRKHATFYYMQEDMIAEMNLVFLRMCDTFQGDQSSFTTWLYTKLNYYLMNYITEEVKRKLAEQDWVEENPFPEYYELSGLNELLNWIDLTENQKTILWYRYGMDFTHQQIADELGVTPQAVLNAENRAIRRLKNTMV
jgi:RNA polymerase sigma factor (sigma-70 family)